MLLEIKVKPNGSKDEILSFKAPNFLEISLKAKAENNQANEALIKFLAKVLKVDSGKIKIIKGKTSRKKIVSVENLTAKEISEVISL
ncbi:MAG: DUF167 domain-containing protein [Caldimicrobium sp.]